MTGKKRLRWLLYGLSVALIVVYPLRRAGAGVDLWDAGYNYANFTYSGPEYMDSMWYFATWLSNLYGSMLTRLPLGGTMRGMNVYTSLTAGAIAAAAYLFCTKKLKIPAWLAFAGEMTALGLCWAPTAVLYNYLTYGLFLGASMLIYEGLTGERRWCLALAGVVLGLNVGVRFPNLAQAGMILAVWYAAFLYGKKAPEVLRETGLCVLGYAGGCALFLVPIALRYGLGAYWEGIGRLFAMTGQADDYAASAMLTGLLSVYTDTETVYWMKRFGVLLAAGLGVSLAVPKRWERAAKAVVCVLTFCFVCLIWRKGFCSADYASYASIYMPCVFAVGAAGALCVLQLLDRRGSRERKLLAAMLFLTLVLGTLGSNNYMYGIINNLFLVLPCFGWLLVCFIREKKGRLCFPFQAAAAALLLLLAVQAALFGGRFVYEEAAGARDVTAMVEGVPVLEGMRTGAQKARQLEELYRFLEDEGRRECVLYGGIPGISYYMELLPAANIWGDLRSCSYGTMEAELDRLAGRCAAEGEYPLVILGGVWAGYLERPEEAAGCWDPSAVEKLWLVQKFLEKASYEKVYDDDMFVVYRSGG